MKTMKDLMKKHQKKKDDVLDILFRQRYKQMGASFLSIADFRRNSEMVDGACHLIKSNLEECSCVSNSILHMSPDALSFVLVDN